MQHAEAHERLADLALEPARLERFEEATDAASATLRAHVRECATCAADVAGWLATWRALGSVGRDSVATRDPAVPADQPLRPPASLRERTLRAAVGHSPDAGVAPGNAGSGPGALLPAGPHGIGRPRTPGRLAWLVAAASVAIAVIVGSYAAVATADLRQARAESTQLAAITAAFERVLASTPSWTVTLRTADGAAGGTLAWSDDDLLVVSSALPVPRPGEAYRCWIEKDGVRTEVGEMSFSGRTAWWAGPMTGWAASFTPGARFVVTLGPVDGGGTPLLVGTIS